MARLPEFIAAFTTAGPPVTTSSRTFLCFISACADSMVGSASAQSRFSGPPAETIASLSSWMWCARHLLRARVDVEDHRVAAGHHADAVVDDRLGGVGRRGDGADHAEGRALDQHQPVVAGERDGLEDLRARRLVRAQQVLLDLVLDVARARSPRPPSRASSSAWRRVASRIASMTRSRVSSDVSLPALEGGACGRGGRVQVVEDALAARVERRARRAAPGVPGRSGAVP